MIRYDGEVVYSESGSGIKATNRILWIDEIKERL